ncbi:unnamed protein product [Didymodactylos carnosus]|uniref:Coiled-coil domain-containing protein 39 n=1 Tax=Didymodactylos carnosus TaxID=1234261 RepID=A0A8S2DF09_9BILA|nr:unnamed protein product [Didymodactylos carnosus]CAF3691578.1 unnamed protein product [Didymodactylos carnosus]
MMPGHHPHVSQSKTTSPITNFTCVWNTNKSTITVYIESNEPIKGMFIQGRKLNTDFAIGTFETPSNMHLVDCNTVESKTKQVICLQGTIDENVDRIRMLDNHYKAVDDELASTQRLLAAHRIKTTTDNMLIENDKIEIKRLKFQMKTIDHDLTKFSKRKLKFEKEINILSEKIKKITNVAVDEQEILEKFINFLKKRDDETIHLMKYTRQDDAKIKELIVEAERLSEKSCKIKRAAEEETMSFSSLQVRLIDTNIRMKSNVD